MTTSIATPPKLQFFSSSGVPLSGGKLYSYAAGTTTPLATYTSSSGGTANTNPVILDSRGEANVWFNAVSYKLKLTSSTDVEIWTVDNLNGPDQTTLASLAASSGSSLVGYTQGGAGAVATTVQAKLRQTVSVKDFGAVGDGVTNDTTAMQNALSSGASVVYIPAGTYLISTKLTFSCNIYGDGFNTIIKTVGDIIGLESTTSYGFIKSVSITSNGGGSTNNHGLMLKGCARTLVDGVYISSMGGHGIWIDSTSASNNLLNLSNVQSVSNGMNGIYVFGGADNNAMTLENIDVRGNTDSGLVFNSPASPNISNCNFLNSVSAQSNTNYGVAFLGALTRNNVGWVYLENNGVTDLYFDSDAHGNFIQTTNDGTSIVDLNGFNTVLSAGSSPSSRYTFNSVDFVQARIYNGTNVGQLVFTQSGDRAFAITTTGTTGASSTTFAKGATASHSVTIEGSLQATSPSFIGDYLSVSNPTYTGTWPTIRAGAGSPEGSVAARIGSIYQRTDGGAGTSFYVKESGTGNTGWAAK
jgi:hypothetical protein